MHIPVMTPLPASAVAVRVDADYGRAAYEAFCQAAREFAPSGGFPRWTSEKFPEMLKQAWTAAALAARAVK